MGARTSFADFIEGNVGKITDEAEAFAASQMPDGIHLDKEALRDHIPEILAFIASDMRTGQNELQRRAKSRGSSPTDEGTSAAHLHGRLRAKSGFSIDQMVAEYRAIRASVLRLWVAEGTPDPQSFGEMVRFNEAIDQSIEESVADFSAEAAAWREVFLGLLGHDLRGPLNVITLTSAMMSQMASDTPFSEQIDLLMTSGRRMNQLLDDLLDYSRTALGMGIRITRVEGSLSGAVLEEVGSLRLEFPENTIQLECAGTIDGAFDHSRVREALHNLVANAVKYGARKGVIRVALRGSAEKVQLSVENEGNPPSSDILNTMFEPLRRGSSVDDYSRNSLGLGLFIVREIAKAHGGEVTVEVSERITTFTMCLARESTLTST